MSEDNLKPCPFCGKTPELLSRRYDRTKYQIACVFDGCACMPDTWLYTTKEEAVRMWNARQEMLEDEKG